MKNRFAFWMIVGIGTGAAAGMTYDNLPAGLSFGTASGIIANLITLFNIFQRDNKRTKQ